MPHPLAMPNISFAMSAFFLHFPFFLLSPAARRRGHSKQGPEAGDLQRDRDEPPVAQSHQRLRHSSFFPIIDHRSRRVWRRLGTPKLLSAHGFRDRIVLQRRPMVACVFELFSSRFGRLRWRESATRVRFDRRGWLHVIVLCSCCTSALRQRQVCISDHVHRQ